ncbi:MAG: PEGA domain-containing protein [Polyangiaceae bacterium]|jgi:hypothetical protein|nr:PEGA domain-containing protein [Polyangiaceae bacterium]
MTTLLRTLLSILVMSLLVVTSSGVALAQAGKIREELPEKLRPSWDAAGDLFDDANFDAALVEYQRIYAESKNPRVLYNVGVCWKERKFYARAVEAWEKQLAEKDKLPAAEVERARSSMEVVLPFVTTLDLTSNQSGAKLLIKDLEVGLTPLAAPVRVDVGPNKLVLEKPGFARAERTIEVLRDQPVKLTMNMIQADKTAPAKITVSGAEGATIFIDGTEMGPAPFAGEVPTGRHTFEARLKGYVTARQTSEVQLGEPLRVTLTLVEDVREGKVRIKTDHPDAVITIDGAVMGLGAWEGLLRAGGHTLEIKKDGYRGWTQELALEADQERVLDVSLERDASNAWIYWTVTGIAVAAGAATACYFVFKPAETAPVTGTFDPGVVPTLFRF